MQLFKGNWLGKNIIKFVSFPTDLLTDIDNMCEDYMGNIRGLSPPEKKDYLNKIESAFKKSREYGDDKVQLAIQTYEMVCSIWAFQNCSLMLPVQGVWLYVFSFYWIVQQGQLSKLMLLDILLQRRSQDK